MAGTTTIQLPKMGDLNPPDFLRILKILATIASVRQSKTNIQMQNSPEASARANCHGGLIDADSPLMTIRVTKSSHVGERPRDIDTSDNLDRPFRISVVTEQSKNPATGDQISVAELFSQCGDRLSRLIEFRLDHRLRSRIDPADVLQEAFIEIAGRHAEYSNDPQVCFYVWARQLTLQVLIDLQRRHFGQKRSPQQEVRLGRQLADATSDSIAQVISAQLTSPSGAAIRVEETQRLHSALASMDEIDREVLAMRHFEHLGNTEVAEALGLSVTAASNRYIRAMTRLGEILRRVMEEPE